MIIPTLSTLALDNAGLDALMETGFCYVKLADANLVKTIQTCIQIARDFFKSDTAEKEKWKLKETLLLGDRYQGYALRSQSKNTNAIEQLFFEPEAPFGPYEIYAPLIQQIDNSFKTLIFLPLMTAIFKRLNFTPVDLNEAMNNPNFSLVFQCCPTIGESKNAIRLNAHKDFGLLTIVFFDEPGLEVKYQDEWQAILPQTDCVVVNLGNALELMTGKRCHSALHRVINATENRISMVYFTNPNYQQQVRNFTDNSVIATSGEQFFKQQFSEYYELDH